MPTKKNIGEEPLPVPEFTPDPTKEVTMPTKKNIGEEPLPVPEFTPDPTKEVVEEQPPKKEEAPPKCGHINKHFINYKHKLEDLFCDLPSGHTEPTVQATNSNQVFLVHQADYQTYEACSPEDEGAVMVGGSPRLLVTKRADWLDAAATPVKEIKRDIESLREIRRLRAIEEEGKYI